MLCFIKKTESASRISRIPSLSLLLQLNNGFFKSDYISTNLMSLRTYGQCISFLQKRCSTFDFLPTALPLRSNTSLQANLWMQVFCMMTRQNGIKLFEVSLQTPQMRAMRDLFLVSVQCLIKSSSIPNSVSFSLFEIVLMTNLRSLEKKKKDPDLPAPCPALNTCSLLFSKDRDSVRSQ